MEANLQMETAVCVLVSMARPVIYTNHIVNQVLHVQKFNYLILCDLKMGI